MFTIIPAAGLGTRFLPFTKAVPKELLPILTRPAIEWILEEGVYNHLNKFVIVTNTQKEILRTHFSPLKALNEFLIHHNKLSLLKESNTLLEKADLTFTLQEQPLGLGHAILCAEDAITAKDRIAIMLPDELLFTSKGIQSSFLSTMQYLAHTHNANVIAVKEVALEETSAYGIIEGVQMEDKSCFLVKQVVEKPTPQDAPSRLAIIGRYILEYSIFDALKITKPGKNGELQLTDGIEIMIKEGHKIIAYVCEEIRHDVGNVHGWLQANAFLAQLNNLNN